MHEVFMGMTDARQHVYLSFDGEIPQAMPHNKSKEMTMVHNWDQLKNIMASSLFSKRDLLRATGSHSAWIDACVPRFEDVEIHRAMKDVLTYVLWFFGAHSLTLTRTRKSGLKMRFKKVCGFYHELPRATEVTQSTRVPAKLDTLLLRDILIKYPPKFTGKIRKKISWQA